MEVFLALLGATGVLVAMAANVTNIARFVSERRRAAAQARANARRPGPPREAEAPPRPAAQTSEADATDTAATIPASVFASTPGLPSPPTTFVGRERLLDDLKSLLSRPDVRLLTLYGPGGAGKSRVAIELASRVRSAFADDVSYVSLAAVREPELVPSTLAIGLGVHETTGASAVQAMQRALARRGGLLVIDNFEHLLSAAHVIAELMRAAPALTVLVTSRALLRLSVEVAYPIPPLDLPAGHAPPDDLQRSEAVHLFVERAQAVDPRFALDGANLDAIVEICRRVDALPLAIELAAARLRSLPPQQLLARMRRRLPILTGGPRDAPERQRTLRNTIEWSVALLEAHHRQLFTRLSMFEGGASVELIEQVFSDEPDLIDALTVLVDNSLLQRVGEDDEERMTMLETVREYANERFEVDPERTVLRERHARAYLAWAERGAKALKGSDQARWGRWLVRDLGNLRAAMTTLLELRAADEALRLATALRPLFMARCHYQEGRRLLELALDLGRDLPGSTHAAAQLALGALIWRQGDLTAALPPLRTSLDRYREAGDAAGEAGTLRLLGIHAHQAGDYALATDRLERALAMMRVAGDEEGIANTLLSLGNVAFERGEASAAAYYEQSRTITERIGDTLGVAYALDNLSVLAWCRGELARSARLAEQAAELYAELDHPFGLASIQHRRGLLALARADLAGAAVHLDACLRLRSDMGEGRGCAFVRYDLGRLALAEGRLADARSHLSLGLDHALGHGGPLVEVLYLEGIAALLAREGRAQRALELLVAAETWRASHGVPGCAINREQHDALRRDLVEALTEETRAEAEARGAGWEVGEALRRAQLLVTLSSTTSV